MREQHGNHGSASRLTRDAHVAAVEEDDLLNDRQAQPRATRVAGARWVGAVETVENARQDLGGNSRAGIAYLDANSSILPPRAQRAT